MLMSKNQHQTLNKVREYSNTLTMAEKEEFKEIIMRRLYADFLSDIGEKTLVENENIFYLFERWIGTHIEYDRSRTRQRTALATLITEVDKQTTSGQSREDLIGLFARSGEFPEDEMNERLSIHTRYYRKAIRQVEHITQAQEEAYITAREIPTSDLPSGSTGASSKKPMYAIDPTATPTPKGKRVHILSNEEEEEEELPNSPITK